MLSLGLFDRNSDRRLAVSYVTRPIGVLESLQATSNSLIETLSSNLDRMLDAFDIAARDSAGSKRHVVFVARSLFARQKAVRLHSLRLRDGATLRQLRRHQEYLRPHSTYCR